MHELVRLAFHNWYVFQAVELDVNGMIAVIGTTGAGKSAILDGVQVVITGDNHNFIDLNPSAGERSDRTVLSYCLGQISDFERGEPRRDRSETILALTFRDQETGAPITIGLLPDARLFLRSFNNAVLAREIRDPTDFVRRFVLEAEPLNVERIRSSIETWRLLEQRTEALEAELRGIRAVRGRFATWARETLQAQTEE